jgi:hypothetical protein
LEVSGAVRQLIVDVRRLKVKGPTFLDLNLLLTVSPEPDSITALQDRRSAVQAADSSLLQIFEAGSGPYPEFCSVGTVVLLWG